MSELPNPVILITGASRGLGLALIQRLLTSSPNTNIILACRNPESGQLAVKSLPSPPISISPTLTKQIHVLPLDVTSPNSITSAVDTISSTYGRLDVLINNAGYAAIPKSDMSDYISITNSIFAVNVTGVSLTTTAFLPLLRAASAANPKYGGRVINISSGRGSISRAASSELTPSVSLPYDVSKTAMNRLTVGMAVAEEKEGGGVDFQLVNPGHCKTAFNGYKGLRDPVTEGVTAVVELLGKEKGVVGLGVWETKGTGTELFQVPW